MDWDDPVQRADLIRAVGPAEYNRRIEQHHADSAVAFVNGYRIRPVGSRFGIVFMIDGANVGYRTQAEAEQRARQLPPHGSA